MATSAMMDTNAFLSSGNGSGNEADKSSMETEDKFAKHHAEVRVLEEEPPMDKDRTFLVEEPVKKDNETQPPHLRDNKTQPKHAHQDETKPPHVRSPLLDGEPLDNYYSRPRSTFNSQKVPLVLGGSDGSGTRAFVSALGRLGVPFLVDDGTSMDIHAVSVFGGKGWPPLAKLILNNTHSSQYTVELDLPLSVRQTLKKEFAKLLTNLEKRYPKLMKKTSVRNVTDDMVANNIRYAFKAPITLLLLPSIQKYMYPQGFKYLHIVRDGRDISLSNNQSPVMKFYRDMYLDAQARLDKYSEKLAPVLGMQLWNDWNGKLFDKMTSSGNNDTTLVDYLVMRTEDLLNPESKFEALTLLADFVGSTKTPHDLCCESRHTVVDMGKSGQGSLPDDKLGSLIESQVKDLKANIIKKGGVAARYGKWAMMLASNEKLSKALHEEGKEALKSFGYEPPQRFMDKPPTAVKFECDATVECPEMSKSKCIDMLEIHCSSRRRHGG